MSIQINSIKNFIFSIFSEFIFEKINLSIFYFYILIKKNNENFIPIIDHHWFVQ